MRASQIGKTRRISKGDPAHAPATQHACAWSPSIRCAPAVLISDRACRRAKHTLQQTSVAGPSFIFFFVIGTCELVWRARPREARQKKSPRGGACATRPRTAVIAGRHACGTAPCPCRPSSKQHAQRASGSPMADMEEEAEATPGRSSALAFPPSGARHVCVRAQRGPQQRRPTKPAATCWQQRRVPTMGIRAQAFQPTATPEQSWTSYHNRRCAPHCPPPFSSLVPGFPPPSSLVPGSFV